MVEPVTGDGRMTLPKEVRDHLRIGDGVRFIIEEGGRVTVCKAPQANRTRTFEDYSEQIERVRGTATADLTTDQIIRLMRGDPDEA